MFQLAWKKKTKNKTNNRLLAATVVTHGVITRHNAQCLEKPAFIAEKNHFAAICESEGKPGAVKALFIHQIMADDESVKITISTGTKSMAVPIRALPDTGSQLDAICY